MKKTLFIFLLPFFFSGCTIYTEKRSEALSQAVYATSDSIQYARIDLAKKYAEESKKLAFPPKKRIEISPISTKKQSNAEIKKEIVKNTTFSSSVDINETENSDILRLVIPEEFKNHKLLVENSDEWQELLKTKEFAEKLQKDNKNLETLKKNVEQELLKQYQMNEKMVKDLNIMQKKLIEKDFAIWQRNVAIVLLLGIIGAGVYLRMKGFL